VKKPPLLATGWSLYLPGVWPGMALSGHVEEPWGGWAWQESPEPAQAALLLGRKGLLYKEPAVRLALCAVHRALGLAPKQRADWPTATGTAVVACSNLGNVETVDKVTRTIAAEGGRAVSVLDAPNVSSNVIASSVALWFRFGGPNLMVCSGPSAGEDGLRLAGLLLRAGRADRVVLVGAEPDDEVATALHRDGRPAHSLRAAAACVVLESWHRDVPGTPEQALVELVDEDEPWPRRPRLTIGEEGFDPTVNWGDHYGARGVVALALAAHLATGEGHGTVAVHGHRRALVSPAGAGGSR
jgi:3-oxoacyl-[acyl-carrier-protein] synthase II